MPEAQINGTLHVTGAITSDTSITPGDSTVTNSKVSSAAAISRSKLAQDVLAKYPIHPTDWRVWDNFTALLPQTAGTDDDLAVIEGTLGTDFPTIQGADFGGGGGTAEDKYARTLFTLPPEYDDAQSVTIRARCTYLTTVPDAASYVDFVVYEHNGDGAVGSDLCATSAQNVVTAGAGVFTNYDFTVTATTLVSGDQLDIRVLHDGQDSGNAGVMIFEMTQCFVMIDIKG